MQHNLDGAANQSLVKIAERLAKSLARNALIQNTTDQLRCTLNADRIALYYFYRQWKGQVTFESLSDPSLSILGETGADDCFNQEYAALYLAGRTKSTADIETEPIHECHRQFLRSIQVRANLVVPVLTPKGLWGLLVAHHCQNARSWTDADVTAMSHGAAVLADMAIIRDS